MVQWCRNCGRRNHHGRRKPAEHDRPLPADDDEAEMRRKRDAQENGPDDGPGKACHGADRIGCAALRQLATNVVVAG